MEDAFPNLRTWTVDQTLPALGERVVLQREAELQIVQSIPFHHENHTCTPPRAEEGVRPTNEQERRELLLEPEKSVGLVDGRASAAVRTYRRPGGHRRHEECAVIVRDGAALLQPDAVQDSFVGIIRPPFVFGLPRQSAFLNIRHEHLPFAIRLAWSLSYTILLCRKRPGVYLVAADVRQPYAQDNLMLRAQTHVVNRKLA